ncbi:MAG: Tfp pilus assembly protein FimT/FimU [Dissulfurispiraceae bacterium]
MFQLYMWARRYSPFADNPGARLQKNNPVLSELQKGFTLLELLVVIFLVSLLMAIVFPSMYGAEGISLKSDAQRIASVLRYLNDSSITTKDPYSLTFDFGGNTISWKGPDVEKTEQLRSLSSVELPSKGKVGEGQVIVSFGPLGIQENLVVHLRQAGETMMVVFNQLSGRAAIKTDDR